MPRVLVIIPAYNEVESIAQVIQSIKEHVPDYSILVVNDGSADATERTVRRFHGVELINLPYNMGIGSAMQTGYKYAQQEGFDIAIQCDGDGQHPVHQLTKLVDHIENSDADMVIGSRYVTDTDYTPSFSRRVGKSLLSRIVDSVVGGGVTDTTSGFRAANRAVIATFARTYPDDYPEAEALVIMHKHGLKAVEIPVDMLPRQGGRSSIGPASAAYYAVKVSLAIFIGVFKKITHAPGELTEEPEATSAATLHEETK